jgi:hypothetical protein
MALVILSNAITEITATKLQACHDVRTEGAEQAFAAMVDE